MLFVLYSLIPPFPHSVGAIFSGNPTLKSLTNDYDIKLSVDERAFMDNQVEKLCEVLNDYEIASNRDLPDNVWALMKEEKFFGMIIPKQYGRARLLGFKSSFIIAIFLKTFHRWLRIQCAWAFSSCDKTC